MGYKLPVEDSVYGGNIEVPADTISAAKTLAMSAGAARVDIDGMVLWDQVVRGEAYLQELTVLHQDMLKVAHVKLKPRTTDGEHAEILGFPLTDFMLTDLENSSTLVSQNPAGRGKRRAMRDNSRDKQQTPFSTAPTYDNYLLL